MAIRLIGTEGAKPCQVNPNLAARINPSDFRGVAYQVEANLLDAQYELQKADVINKSAMIKSRAASQSGANVSDSSSGSSSSSRPSSSSGRKAFDPSLDVSEREKFEYTKSKDAQDFQRAVNKDKLAYEDTIRDDKLSERKFEEDVKRDRRDYATKRQDLQMTKTAEEQYALAQKDVEEATASFQKMLRSGGGMSQVRDSLSKILSRYPALDGDAKRDIIKQVYQPAQDVIKEQISRTQEKVREIQGYNRSTVLSQERVRLQGLNVALESATGTQRTNILSSINAAISGIASNEKLDPLDRAFIVSQITDDIVKSGRGGAELSDMMRRYDGYMQEVAGLHTRRDSISAQQYAYEESRLVSKYNLQGTNVARLNDPYQNEKKILETEQVLRDIKKLRTEKFLDNKYGINAERGGIGTLAKQYATPAGIEALKSYAQRNGNPPGLSQAVKVAEGLVEFRKTYFETQSKVSEFNKEIALLQSSTAQQVMSMLGSGSMDVTSMALFSQLSPDIQQKLSQNKGLTQEQRNKFMSQYAGLRQNAVRYAEQQRDFYAQTLNVKRQELELYVGKDSFAAYEAVKNNKEQIKQQVQKKPVGVSPQRSSSSNSQQWAGNALQQLQNLQPQNAPPTRAQSPRPAVGVSNTIQRF